MSAECICHCRYGDIGEEDVHSWMRHSGDSVEQIQDLVDAETCLSLEGEICEQSKTSGLDASVAGPCCCGDMIPQFV